MNWGHLNDKVKFDVILEVASSTWNMSLDNVLHAVKEEVDLCE